MRLKIPFEVGLQFLTKLIFLATLVCKEDVTSDEETIEGDPVPEFGELYSRMSSNYPSDLARRARSRRGVL
jgi:hypothetical protein